MTKEELIAECERMLAPCLWHGEQVTDNGRYRTEGGAGFCAQCARRDDRIAIKPRALLDILRA